MSDHNATYDSVYPAITDVTPDEIQNLVLLMGHSEDDKFSALAFRVFRTVRRTQEFTAAGPSVNDTNSLDFGYLGADGHEQDVSSPGEDILRIEGERDRTIVEYGIGSTASGIHLGVQTTASGSVITGLRDPAEGRARSISADDLADYAGVLSDHTLTDSPTSIPTTALSAHPSQGIVRIDSKDQGNNPIRIGIENQSGSNATDIDFEAVGQAYEVRPVRDGDVVRDMVAAEGFERRVLTYGGFENDRPNLPTDWQANKQTFTYAEIPGIPGI